MGRQSRFHLAVLGVGSALGGFLFAFSRFTLGSALAVAPLTRIQSGPAAGTGTVVTHSPLTPFTSSGRAPNACTAQRPSSPRRTGGTYHAHVSSWQRVIRGAEVIVISGQILFSIIFLSWGVLGSQNTNFRVSKIKVLLEKVTFQLPTPPPITKFRCHSKGLSGFWRNKYEGQSMYLHRAISS